MTNHCLVFVVPQEAELTKDEPGADDSSQCWAWSLWTVQLPVEEGKQYEIVCKVKFCENVHCAVSCCRFDEAPYNLIFCLIVVFVVEMLFVHYSITFLTLS